MAKKRPGKMTERITFLEEINTPVPSGGQNVTTSPIANAPNMWAEVNFASGNEVSEFESIQAEGKYIFSIRFRNDILESYRILWRGVEYNIKEIKQRMVSEMYLEIVAEKGVAQ